MKDSIHNPNSSLTTLVGLLTAAHLSEWDEFTQVINELTEDETKIILMKALGLLYGALSSNAKHKDRDVLDVLAELSLNELKRQSEDPF